MIKIYNYLLTEYLTNLIFKTLIYFDECEEKFAQF